MEEIKVRFFVGAPKISARSITDNILGFELRDGGSIPSGRTKQIMSRITTQ